MDARPGYNIPLHCHYEMFVLNPDSYLLPVYRISPFRTSDIELNNKLADSNTVEDYFKARFKGKAYLYTLNGREAISLALSYYNLQKDDLVTIFTTSGNHYVSSCVTSEIEKYCRWSRKIEPQTKVILVNHEFGYPFNGINHLKETGIPIIEDCAHTFFSHDAELTTGTTGDFAIYSFPKMFPLQIGGLLVANDDFELPLRSMLKQEEERYMKNVLSYHIDRRDELIQKRLLNYGYLAAGFREIGMDERFELTKGVVPGVFMFRKGNHRIELTALKRYFWAHGIQCSVFYGEESFFIPVHQSLNKADLEYFIIVMKSFLEKN